MGRPDQYVAPAAYAGARVSGVAGPSRAVVLGVAVVVVPALIAGWLLAAGAVNRELLLPAEHFVVVTVVSVLMLGLAVLVAIQAERSGLQLIALGFMAMAGLFAVHALSTPGVMLHGPAAPGPYGMPASGLGYDYGSSVSSTVVSYDYNGTVIGLSAFLSLFIPAFLFAASVSLSARRLVGRLPTGGAVLLVIVLLTAYALLASTQGDLIASSPLGRPPLSYMLAMASVALLAFAAWRQWQTYTRTRYPSHGAFVLAFLLLAEAQILVVAAPFWTLAWWEYHLLMLSATILALAALVVELNRRRALERFLAPAVVERVVAGDLWRLLEGEQRVATILFADLRGSTGLAEGRSPRSVVELLNAYVGAMADCVLREGGMLQRYLGDGIMAIFGALEPDPSDGVLPAARATLSMREAIRALNERRAATGEEPVGFGVGIHTGEVLLGCIGVRQQADITAFGDTVNTAARLQELTKHYGVNTVLSADAAERLPSARWRLAPLGPAEIRGRRETVSVFALEEAAPEAERTTGPRRPASRPAATH